MQLVLVKVIASLFEGHVSMRVLGDWRRLDGAALQQLLAEQVCSVFPRLLFAVFLAVPHVLGDWLNWRRQCCERCSAHVLGASEGSCFIVLGT
jgi:hypothetical protein